MISLPRFAARSEIIISSDAVQLCGVCRRMTGLNHMATCHMTCVQDLCLYDAGCKDTVMKQLLMLFPTALQVLSSRVLLMLVMLYSLLT